MNPDRCTMSQQELQRVPVLDAVLTQRMTQTAAAGCLQLSTRQVRRLQQRLARDGPGGLAHRARGRASNARTPAPQRARALALIRTHYPDFGPTLASEQLAQRDIHPTRIKDHVYAGRYQYPEATGSSH